MARIRQLRTDQTQPKVPPIAFRLAVGTWTPRGNCFNKALDTGTVTGTDDKTYNYGAYGNRYRM
jgi:hypothetical protein